MDNLPLITDCKSIYAFQVHLMAAKVEFFLVPVGGIGDWKIGFKRLGA